MSSLPPASQWLHLDWMLVVMAGWLVVGVAGVIAPAPVRRGVPRALPCRWLARPGAVRPRPGCAAGHTRGRGAAHRPAGVAFPSSAGQPLGLLPDGDRCSVGRHLDFRGRLLPQGRRHATGTVVPGVPRVPGQHGRRHPDRRRLLVHGDVGDDGLVLVLPGDGQSPHSRSAQRRLPLHHDGAHRRHRDPDVLRRAAGQYRRLHLREHAGPGP